MKFIMTTVEVDGKTVDAVKEWGDVVYWTPGEEHAFQVHHGRRVAGTAFEAFGSDYNRAFEIEGCSRTCLVGGTEAIKKRGTKR